MTDRQLKYFQAIHEATDLALGWDGDVLLMGLGVPGPTGIFGTTKGLQEKHGATRVIDMPSSENAMTGVALGAATRGKRPIMVHMRVDFAVLSLEPIVNQAAKWHYMYGGRMRAPLVIRMIIGRGWGQGPQHSQSLQAWFAHVPGLKVVMPSRPYDAKGMLLAAVQDDAPVIILEHRWLYNLEGPVPDGMYAAPLEGAAVLREGTDVTLAACSYMVIEAMRAAETLAGVGVSAEVVDLRSVAPLDMATLGASVAKTGRLVAADTGHAECGVSAEIVAAVSERCFASLKAAPRRIALPPIPSPTTPALADLYYPGAREIAVAALATLGRDDHVPDDPLPEGRQWRDTPDPSFTGPY
ncbi:MAG: transketolase C-terminal domain-containing protein [Pseudomonadota bacterium]